MKDILTFLLESNTEKLSDKLLESKDFLIVASNNDMGSKLTDQIEKIVKQTIKKNTVIWYIDEDTQPKDFIDSDNPMFGQIAQNKGNCVLLLMLENTDPKILNSLMPIILKHNINDKIYKEMIVGVVTPNSKKLSNPILSRLGNAVVL